MTTFFSCSVPSSGRVASNGIIILSIGSPGITWVHRLLLNTHITSNHTNITFRDHLHIYIFTLLSICGRNIDLENPNSASRRTAACGWTQFIRSEITFVYQNKYIAPESNSSHHTMPPLVVQGIAFHLLTILVRIPRAPSSWKIIGTKKITRQVHIIRKSYDIT